MESLSELINNSDLTQLAILAVVLVIGLVIIRFAFKLTATLVRVGCVLILLIVGTLFVLSLF